MSSAQFNDQIILERSLMKNVKLGALVGSLEGKIWPKTIFWELAQYRSNDFNIIQRSRLSNRRDPIGISGMPVFYLL